MFRIFSERFLLYKYYHSFRLHHIDDLNLSQYKFLSNSCICISCVSVRSAWLVLLIKKKTFCINMFSVFQKMSDFHIFLYMFILFLFLSFCRCFCFTSICKSYFHIYIFFANCDFENIFWLENFLEWEKWYTFSIS